MGISGPFESVRSVRILMKMTRRRSAAAALTASEESRPASLEAALIALSLVRFSALRVKGLSL